MQNGKLLISRKARIDPIQLTCSECFACPAWVTAHRMNVKHTTGEWLEKETIFSGRQLDKVQEARPVKTVKISVKEAKPLLGQDRRWGTFLYSIATDWVTGRSPTNIYLGA